jgi:PKD repeat protein
MMSRELTQKIVALGITISLIALIFLVFTPSPTIAVHLNPGAPSPSSVYTGTIITFSDVNLTIRGDEAIPVNYLNFSIRQSSNNQEIAYVKFSLNGTEISDSPIGRFTVTNITDTSTLPYQSSGDFYGIDERTGAKYTFDYGYGYDMSPADLTILYTIRYTTHTTGTFYAQLYVSTFNATARTYASGFSTSFTIASSSPPPSGGGSSDDDAPAANAGGPYTGVVGTPVLFDGSKSTAVLGKTISSYSWIFGDGTTSVGTRSSHTYLTAGTYNIQLTVTDSTGLADIASTTATISPAAPSAPSVTISNQTLQNIETSYGVLLDQPFYASDTNGDGKVDVFTDPNNVLTPLSLVNISGHASFLLSTHHDDIPAFFWDTVTNSITPITHTLAQLSNPIIYTANKTVNIQFTINKTGWIYLDITDTYPVEEYPQYTLTIKTGDRTISPDKIWRKNGKIYILDDPAFTYELIYGFTILPPVFHPENGMTLITSRPTITITYPQLVYMLAALLDGNNIMYQFTTTDNKAFTFTPPTDLTEGIHILSLTVQDDLGRNTLTSTSMYTVSLPKQPAMNIPWTIVVVIAIVLIIAVILIVMRMQGFF